MNLIEIPLEHLHGAPWNANHMDEGMMEHLRESVTALRPRREPGGAAPGPRRATRSSPATRG